MAPTIKFWAGTKRPAENDADKQSCPCLFRCQTRKMVRVRTKRSNVHFLQNVQCTLNRLSPNWPCCIESSVRRWHPPAGGHLVPWYRGAAAQTRHMLTTQLDNFQHLSYCWHGALSHLLVARQGKRKWIFCAYPFLSGLSQLWSSTSKTSFLLWL